MAPLSSITIFDLGYRPGFRRDFLDQVDMGINTGGLVRRVPLSAARTAELSDERDDLHDLLNRLRLSHDAAELDLEDFILEKQELRDIKDKLQRELSEHAERIQDAYDGGDLNNAMGLEQAHKTLRIEMAIRLRDLNQKAFELVEIIKATRKKLSDIQSDTIQAKYRFDMIESRLRPVNNLNDALNAQIPR